MWDASRESNPLVNTHSVLYHQNVIELWPASCTPIWYHLTLRWSHNACNCCVHPCSHNMLALESGINTWVVPTLATNQPPYYRIAATQYWFACLGWSVCLPVLVGQFVCLSWLVSLPACLDWSVCLPVLVGQFVCLSWLVSLSACLGWSVCLSIWLGWSASLGWLKNKFRAQHWELVVRAEDAR